jgi:hypothetical protein
MSTKKIHYCKCRVNLSGQNCHVVTYDEFNPVTWPEVQVLMALHGEENVMDVMPVGIGDTWPNQEKERLIAKYGRIVEQCFPGRSFHMDLVMTGDENLPTYVEGVISTKVHNGNGDDDEDDGEDEVARAANATPSFSPGRHRRPPPPPIETPKEI